MPSPFSKGAQNADKAFSQFASGDVTFFNVTLTTLQTVSAVTVHGLSAAPDFVLATSSTPAVAGGGGIGWTADATSITVTQNNTLSLATISVFAANIS